MRPTASLPSRMFVSVALAFLCAAALHGQKQPDLTFATTSGTFKLPDISSLVDRSALRSAAQVAELALPALKKDTMAAVKDVNAVSDDLKANDAAIVKEQEAVKKGMAALQPKIDAYDRDVAKLQADDRAFQADKAPVQAQIDAYNAIPEKNRTEAQYNRLAALKAPLDARWSVIEGRKAVLDKRADDGLREFNAIQEPLKKLQKRDEELRALMKTKAPKLGEAYRQLQRCQAYAMQITAKLAATDTPASMALTTELNSAAEILKALSNGGFDTK